MRRLTIITGLLAAALASLAVVVPASAVTTSQLNPAHWTCIPAPPVTLQLHCARSERLQGFFDGEVRTLNMLVFDESGTTFLGTEFNMREDIWQKGQPPCPTEDTGEYTNLMPIFGIPYRACHRFDSDHLPFP
jgi:hypothetical protein